MLKKNLMKYSVGLIVLLERILTLKQYHNNKCITTKIKSYKNKIKKFHEERLPRKNNSMFDTFNNTSWFRLQK